MDHSASVAFTAGILLHVFLLRRGEWDLYVLQLAGAFALAELVGALLLYYAYPDAYTVVIAAKHAAGLLARTVAGLYASILTYRAFFHRLNRFPGPFAARLSNFYVTRLAFKKLQLCHEVEKLHERYGDVLRLGPTELSIVHPDAVDAIYSAKSACTKGPFYEVLRPCVSIHTDRDPKQHRERRVAWDRGMGTKALRDYEPRVAKYTDQLLSYVAQNAGKPFNVTEWFNFYTFDAMGDLAFGRSFGMLEQGKKHYFMDTTHGSMADIGRFSHLIWLFPVVKAIPGLNSEYMQFQRWIIEHVEKRRKMELENPDVFSWVLADYNKKVRPTYQDYMNLVGDCQLIVIAGSDTTASVLTNAAFELARNPSKLRTLQQEVQPLFDSGTVDSNTLSKLKYLDAIINETLRLHPAIPGGLQRLTPPSGIRIGETYIPGNTIVQVPQHVLFRDERCFSRATEFLPERWTTESQLNPRPGVFIPFGIGPYACVGKQLGLMEVRYVLSRLAHGFDWSLADGQSEEGFVGSKVDAFTLACGPLEVVFKERTKS